MHEAGPSLECHVQVRRVGRRLRDRAGGLANPSGDDSHRYAVGGCCRRDVLGPEFLILGRRHLLARRQVQPELEAAHPTLVLLGHLRMHEPASRGHPLDASGREHPLIAVVIAVAHAPIEHVGHRLEAAVRVVREAGDIVLRPVGAELIEHEKRIEVRQLRLPDHTPKLHTCTVRSWHAADDPLDRATACMSTAHGFQPFANAPSCSQDEGRVGGNQLPTAARGALVHPARGESLRAQAASASGPTIAARAALKAAWRCSLEIDKPSARTNVMSVMPRNPKRNRRYGSTNSPGWPGAYTPPRERATVTRLPPASPSGPLAV